ncbi:MAG: hypothetical protein Q8O56_06595 [Solirubrobacteraceae bacterium]|nr:hypothetical protein [Solirubrobacteraceae bacterium]
MTRRRLIAGAVAASLVTGCGGGPSVEERRADRADYARAANAVCEQANREIADDYARPKYRQALERSVSASRTSLHAAAVRLHELHARLGDSSSAEIDAFDGAIDPFVTAVGALATAFELGRRQRAASTVRRRGDVLHRAAQAAQLERCGRGGNAIAERATFLAYRQAYIRVDDATIKRIVSIDTSGTGPAWFAAYRAVTRAARRQLRATGRMQPPRELRKLHQAVRRSLSTFLTTRELLTPDTTRERAIVVFAQFDRQFPRYQRLERRLRRELNR